VPKIVRAVNGTVSDDAFPHITQEDLLFLTRCDIVVSALKRICDFQSAPRSPLIERLSSHDTCTDINTELTVYRYSEDKVMGYLQAKVSRLSKDAVSEKSRTIIRNLAKDGIMDDGKEDLLGRRNPVEQRCIPADRLLSRSGAHQGGLQPRVTIHFT
jgi:hypothetical protein